MLILHRRSQESIMIGDDIEIVVLSVKGNNVQLGFQAPGDVTILRKELWEKGRKAGDATPDRYNDG